MQYRGHQLDRFQDESITALQAGHSVLVSAPTGTGKTIIADWIVEQALNEGQQVIYTAPIKALSNQKFRDYTQLYGEENVGLVTGDLVIRRDAPCRVMTTEVLRNMLLSGETLPKLKAVILDEIHFLDDRERGTTWEEVLIYLPKSVQIVGLSATLSNLEEFASWLEAVRETKVVVVEERKRAVPLTVSYASVDTGIVSPREYEKRFARRRPDAPTQKKGRRGEPERKRRPVRRTQHTDLHEMMVERELLPYLYFVFSRRDTELCARRLVQGMEASLLTADERAEVDRRLRAAAGDLGPVLDPELRHVLTGGVGFHHAGAHVHLKALIEQLYEDRLLKVLYCTSIFALGINMPARAVVFDGIQKWDGRGFNPLTTRGFMQKAGRAGRRGLDVAGEVVVRVDFSEFDEIKPVLDRYAAGEVEPVVSSFSLGWNSVVNLLARHDLTHIREIVDKSFLQWHLTRKAESQRQRAAELAESGAPREQKEARRLRQRAGKSDGACFDEFQEKVTFLQHIGYISPDGTFAAGARVVQHLQMSEIPVAELMLAGVFEELSMSELFGVLCALTNELPRRVEANYRMPREDRRVIQRVAQVLASPIVRSAEEFSEQPTAFDTTLLFLGRRWAEGDSLADLLLSIHSDTDVSGDLIAGFRRAKDLAGQLREVYRDLPDRADAITDLIRKVSRDEVEVIG